MGDHLTGMALAGGVAAALYARDRTGEGQLLDKDSRYREQRRWYARDRGETTLRELTRLWLAQPASAG